MTGLERVPAATAGKPTDIVPYDPYISPGHALRLMGRKTHEMFTVPGLLPEAMIHATRFYGSDVVYCRDDMYMGITHDIIEESDGIVFGNRNTGAREYVVRPDSHNLIPLVKDDSSRIHDISEVEEKMPVVSCEKIMEEKGAVIGKYIDSLGESVATFGAAAGVTIKPLRRHRGFEDGLMDLYLNPELAEAIMWRRVEQLKEYARAYATLGCTGYYTGDAEASNDLIPPAIFRSMLVPVYREHIKDIHRAGLIALLHICGKTNDVLEDIADTGADIFESLDPPSLGGNVDLADAKRRVGDRLCLKGNLDAPGVIQPGPTEAVYEASMRAMRAAARGGRYILSTEQVTPSTPPEHVLAMERARRDYRAEVD